MDLDKLMAKARMLPSRQKELGAYYTDPRLVAFLVRWGLERREGSTVMDPSCGDGRFLLEAASQDPQARLFGCDVDQIALRTTNAALSAAGAEATLREGDFFSLIPDQHEPIDLLVGNPPFIRYHLFRGASRRRALASALRLGVQLSQLSSAWAPFLLHAIQFLRVGGGMAMVVPAEITQTQYGLVTLRALLRHFDSLQLIVFEENLFEDAQADTCLLLARGFGQSADSVELIPLKSAADLQPLSVQAPGSVGVSVPLAEGPSGKVFHFLEALLSREQRQAWVACRKLSRVRRLGDLVTVTNGYVTGDNSFFHRSAAEARALELPATWLFPTIRGSRSLRGLYFQPSDISDLEAKGPAHHIVRPQEDLFSQDGAALHRFIEEGKSLGVHERFKCRNRDPWWRVPGLQRADVVVGYMIGREPRISVNAAGAFYTNSLHGLRLQSGIEPEWVALSFLSSLTQLSMEVEGRSYGGGVLKVEPRELDRVLLAWPEEIGSLCTPQLARAVDALLREGDFAGAVELVDQRLLLEGLGISRRRLSLLRAARAHLMKRRTGRARKAASSRKTRSEP